MGKLKEFFVKQFLLIYVKGLLDKIPGNGKKTFIGILILVLGAVIGALPQYAQYIKPIQDFLNQLDPNLIKDANVISLIVSAVGSLISLIGLGHKDLKKMEEKVNGLPPAKQ